MIRSNPKTWHRRISGLIAALGMRLSAHIPIPRNPPIPDAIPLADIRRCAAMVARYVQKEISSRTSLKVRFSITQGTPKRFKMDGKRHRGYYGLHLIITAIMPIPLNQEAYANMLHGDGEINDPSLKLMWDFVGMIEELIPIGILASNISYPGALRCSSGEIRVGGDILLSTTECSNGLAEYLYDSRQLGWPKEIPVSFKRSMQWVTRTLKRSPHVGSDRVSRALSAFSHIATSSESGSSSLTLFWAMMGLESLYCDGSEGLKKQLFDKASILFGPLTDNKKMIRSLYDFRSAFVHGSTNIPYAFCDDYESDNVHNFHEEVYKSQSIAYLLLIASLQWLVKHDKDDLTFEYKIT